MYSAFRPAARRFLSARSATFLARPRSITTLIPNAARLNRPVVSLRVQRRWNSNETPKSSAENEAIKATAESNKTLAAESGGEATSIDDILAQELRSSDDTEAQTLEQAVQSANETNTVGEVAEVAVEVEEGEPDRYADSANDIEPRLTREQDRRPLEGRQIPKETVYIGNLFFDVTAEDLREGMAQFGVVEHVKIIHDSRGLSKGFGYVTFDSVDSAARAIAELNQQYYEGRRIIVQYANGSYRPAESDSMRAPTRTLYIGNLSFDLTDRELNDIFKSVRNVVDVRVAIDRQTGQPRGFAHADFIDVASAQVAAEILSSKAPHGRRLRVDFSQAGSRNRRRQSQKKAHDNEGTGAEE